MKSSKSSWILIIGAGSDIAMAVARKLAARGHNFYLAAHHPQELMPFAQELATRNRIQAVVLPFDVTDRKSHYGFLEHLPVLPQGVLLAVGYSKDEGLMEYEPEEVHHVIDVNFLGCVSILEACATYFEKHGIDFIAAISSISGDRGRQSNYLYNASKAGLTAYLSGLRARLAPKGISVITIKPGVVHTKMTKQPSIPQFLVAFPERVARDIVRAIDCKKLIIYTPWWWRWVMFGIKLIPERLFIRLF